MSAAPVFCLGSMQDEGARARVIDTCARRALWAVVRWDGMRWNAGCGLSVRGRGGLTPWPAPHLELSKPNDAASGTCDPFY